MISDSFTSSRCAEQLRGSLDALGFQSFLFLAQVGKEFPLGLGRSDFDELPVVHYKLHYVGLDPKRCIVRKFVSPVRIEFLCRLHQSDVALLDEIHQVLHPVSLKIHGNLDHKSEICGNELVGGFDIALFAISDRQVPFILPAEKRIALDLVEV